VVIPRGEVEPNLAELLQSLPELTARVAEKLDP
jgi:hypothetical protein